ncbi:MAG: DMT family transporter [Acidiferrobacterales bacterium]|nr:DMT family transporter [Acidiferrobacterales bacterium]
MNADHTKLVLATIFVVSIWASTPLAIDVCAGSAPHSSAFVRMFIGAVFSVSLTLTFTHGSFSINKQALRLYTLNGLSIYLATSCLYLAAKTVPSGWVAVFFGMSPIITHMLSTGKESYRNYSHYKRFGLALGLLGLILIFSSSLRLPQVPILGMVYAMIGVSLTAVTSVITRSMMRRQDLSGHEVASGSLLLALPLFAISFVIAFPDENLVLSHQFVFSTLFLGVLATGAGFPLYFYLLNKMGPTLIAQLSAATPAIALLIGQVYNSEPVLLSVYLGTGLIFTGLLLCEIKVPWLQKPNREQTIFNSPSLSKVKVKKL